MSKLPFKVLGIEHVALAVKDVEMPSNLFGSLLGIEHSSSEEIVDQKVNTHIFDTTEGKIELLDARSDDSPISKFLENRGEELNEGQIILTGTIPRLIPVEYPCRIKVDAYPFGSVETTITK